MDKREVLLLAQLLKTLETVVTQLEQAEQTTSVERFEILRREAISLQKKIEGMI
ncbi:MAG: hypothetical protein AABX53_04525 [Nanoarchaeota archaeon]